MAYVLIDSVEKRLIKLIRAGIVVPLGWETFSSGRFVW